MPEPRAFVRSHPFAVWLGAVVLQWLVLALIAWLSGSATMRLLLAVFTGVLLLTGFGWYGVASLTGRAASGLQRPAVLLGVAWLLACCSALAGFGRQGKVDPASPSAKQDTPRQPELPPSKLFPKGPVRFLAELDEFDVKAGPWPVRKNGDTGEGKRIVVGGVESPHGIGMHPPAAFGGAYACAKFRLGKEAAVFKAVAAINDTVSWNFSPATFTVHGDGRELWKSAYGGFQHHRSQGCTVNVTDVDVLELRVQVANGNQGTEAVWVEPRVLRSLDVVE